MNQSTLAVYVFASHRSQSKYRTTDVFDNTHYFSIIETLWPHQQIFGIHTCTDVVVWLLFIFFAVKLAKWHNGGHTIKYLTFIFNVVVAIFIFFFSNKISLYILVSLF